MPIDMPPMTLEEALRVYDRPAFVESQTAGYTMRRQAIKDTAFSFGVQVGLVHQIDAINKSVSAKERDLDTVYDFGPYMIHGRVVPPVITEMRDVYTQATPKTLRLSGVQYTIDSQARFSSTAPNWRDYLVLSPAPVTMYEQISAIHPKNGSEKEAWEKALRDGWAQGVDQANLMFERGLDELNRDFTGMLRYHEFVMTGKLTMPVVASESISMTYDGDTVILDETLLRITRLPSFNENLLNWRPSLRKAQ